MFFKITLVDNTSCIVNSRHIEHMSPLDDGTADRMAFTGGEGWLDAKVGTIQKIVNALSREGQFVNVEITK